MAGMAVPGLKPRTPYGGGAANMQQAAPGGVAAPGGFGGGYGGGTQSPPSTPVPRNPSMVNQGPDTQYTDQMGRVHTSWGGSDPSAFHYDASTGMMSQGGTQTGGSTVEDPYQSRLDQDFAAYKNKALFDYDLGKKAQSESGGGGGAGGSGGGGGGGLNVDEIMGILDKLGGTPPPAREQAPGLLAREADPEAVASPSAKSQGFARAKDNAGRIANAALRNLRSEMVSRGIEGSGVEGQLTGNILGETARGVADASFENERNAENQQWEARKLGYQGRLGQRAGDQGFQQNNYSIGTQQRGQDISAQQSRLALAPTVLSLLGRARY